ncbi:class II aldolase/adducin family protein [Methylobacterium sp. 4-46]|uniref:class II aldolase/adducin family protein n=1 Tax=unclassified Methylobacterium TaxID=2615210 RepID=UPI000165C6F7|nr:MULTISPECIES: class II aldolase/adducin family protein [Methylobacterium]ACA17123.1 class II aldolase/adducin family protein [Methylobacterium sp. 4-46]WFT82808.1 class II aldolase/adducin family protein [Methylobacterium nodulans]
MDGTERHLRERIVALCREMNRNGLNQGTAGNISARHGARMLLTPSATPYDLMTPEMIAAMPLDGDGSVWEGPLKPSTEWRFHRDILRSRPDAGAVVHAHPTFATAIAITRRSIPACHYMVAAFGGHDVRCAGYALYGTEALSREALAALRDRTACLLANHGIIAIGESLEKAMWRAVELETLAKQYHHSLQLEGGPVILSRAEIDAVLERFADYGLRGAAAGTP